MNTDSPHHRRSIRIPAYDYSSPGAYFVTLVTQGRACLFGSIIGGEMQHSARGLIADECWRLIPEHFPNAQLGTYVVMPNHLHGIIILHDRDDWASADADARRGTIYRAPAIDRAPAPIIEQFQKPVVGSIPTIVRTYKAAVTRKIARQFGGGLQVWQRNYYEHVIRSDGDHNRIHLYVECNPSNWPADDENPAVYTPV